MTSEEIVKALRYCSNPDCEDCPTCKYVDHGDCLERLVADAAELIERLTAENAEIRVQRRQAAAGADRLSVFERIAQYFRRRRRHDE